MHRISFVRDLRFGPLPVSCRQDDSRKTLKNSYILYRKAVGYLDRKSWAGLVVDEENTCEVVEAERYDWSIELASTGHAKHRDSPCQSVVNHISGKGPF